ncbi:helix-turn-helix transcriptional regulator [Streptomyces sp. NPDC048270]|uniref:helix-turn-helix domain-containing protein n=1 Tax=Streptomyces sp. NPDC048270 TaxID=3154615 RepID=UPI0033C459B1
MIQNTKSLTSHDRSVPCDVPFRPPSALAAHLSLRRAVDRNCAGAAGRFVIARTLRRLRLCAGLTQGQVAKAAGVSVGTVNRYEMWRETGNLTTDTVRAIAWSCGATETDKRYMAELVKSQNDGWWKDFDLPEHSVPLMSFEAEACEEQVYAPNVVPDLLRTERYARALRSEAETSPPYARVVSDASRSRRLVVLQRRSFQLRVVLDESVLRRRAGTHDVMAEQCEHLIGIAQRPNVELQILPFDTVVRSVVSSGPFAVVSWEDESEPSRSVSVVYQEHLGGGTYLDAPNDVDAYEKAFLELRAKAIDPGASLHMLARTRQRLRPAE